MGDLSFTEMKEMVKLRLGARTDMSEWGTSAYDYFGIWVNKAYIQLCSSDRLFGILRKLRFPELEVSTTKSTANAQAYVSDPTDVIAVHEVYDTTNNVKLDWIPWTKYIGYTDRTDTTKEGDPTEWTRNGGKIYLHPTPDAVMTMTVFYKKRPAELSGDQQTLIGAEWDDVIMALATYKGYRWLGDADHAKAIREEIMESISGLVTIYDGEEKARNEYFRPDEGYSRR